MKKKVFVSLLLFTITLGTACAADDQGAQFETQNRNDLENRARGHHEYQGRGQTGNLTFDDGGQIFDVNVNSYDPDYARIIENRVEALPGVNDSTVMVFAYHILAGVDLSAREEEMIPVIWQTILRESKGKEIYISNDPTIFTRIEQIKRGYPLMLQNDLHDLMQHMHR